MSEDINIRPGVLGLGHVGLPTALTMAELGWDVIGADDYQEKAKAISQGEVPFHEPNMEKALRSHPRAVECLRIRTRHWNREWQR